MREPGSMTPEAIEAVARFIANALDHQCGLGPMDDDTWNAIWWGLAKNDRWELHRLKAYARGAIRAYEQTKGAAP